MMYSNTLYSILVPKSSKVSAIFRANRTLILFIRNYSGKGIYHGDTKVYSNYL